MTGGGTTIWRASLVDASGATLLLDETAVAPDDRASTAAAARTTFAGPARLTRRWTRPVELGRAEGEVEVWAAIRVEDGATPRIHLRWTLGASIGEARAFSIDAARARAGYVQVLLGRVSLEPGERLVLEGWAGNDGAAGRLWWDAVWLVEAPRERRAPGLLIAGAAPVLVERMADGTPEPPLAATAPPLPADVEPDETDTRFRRRVRGGKALTAAVAGIVALAAAGTSFLATRDGPAPGAPTGTGVPQTPGFAGGSGVVGAERIAFSTDQDPNAQILVLEGDVLAAASGAGTALDGRLTRITDSSADGAVTRPVWDSSGRVLAFERKLGAEVSVEVMSAPVAPTGAVEGDPAGSPQRLLRVPGRCPALSPAGDEVAFARGTAPTTIHIAEVGGGGERVVGRGGCPSWSPRGDRVAFVDESGRRIVVYDLLARSARPSRVESDAIANPTWSPDGTKLAFAYSGGGIRSAIGVHEPDSDNWYPLATWGDRDVRGIAWSPAGDTIAFDADDGTEGAIYTVPATGVSEAPVPVVDLPGRIDRLGGWSPSGTRIVFESIEGPVSSPTGMPLIYVWREQGEPVQITEGRFPSYPPPSWAPTNTPVPTPQSPAPEQSPPDGDTPGVRGEGVPQGYS